MSFDIQAWLADREKPSGLARSVRERCERADGLNELTRGMRTLYYAELLLKHGGNASAVAREVGLSPTNVQYWIRVLGIDRLDIQVAARKAKALK